MLMSNPLVNYLFNEKANFQMKTKIHIHEAKFAWVFLVWLRMTVTEMLQGGSKTSWTIEIMRILSIANISTNDQRSRDNTLGIVSWNQSQVNCHGN